MLNKGFMIFSIITGVITTAMSFIATVDQIKNGDRHAAISGDAAGRAIIDELEKRKFKLFENDVDSK